LFAGKGENYGIGKAAGVPLNFETKRLGGGAQKKGKWLTQKPKTKNKEKRRTKKQVRSVMSKKKVTLRLRRKGYR